MEDNKPLLEIMKDTMGFQSILIKLTISRIAKYTLAAISIFLQHDIPFMPIMFWYKAMFRSHLIVRILILDNECKIMILAKKNAGCYPGLLSLHRSLAEFG